MTKEAELICKLQRQQAAIAAFGTFALREHDLSVVLNEAARVCAQGLAARFSKIGRFRSKENDIIVEAGFGWKAGVIGSVKMHADDRTPQGRAFSTRQPSICNVLENESGFVLPSFYADHGIISTIDVVIIGNGHPYGVLEVDHSEQTDYDQHDINFLTGFANVLGEAVATARRIHALAETLGEMELLIAEKNRLLDQKKMLAEELQHRVRNNLQLVYGMLSKQVDDTADRVGRRGLKAIANRVFTLAQVYDQLLGTEMASEMEFCGYLRALCSNLLEVQGPPAGEIVFDFACDAVMLDLDTVTSLGIIVAEVLTNSFDHAIPSGGEQISISLHNPSDADVAVMIIGDDGPGFVPSPESKRHGVGLVRRLSEQIGGSATLSLERGTAWIIEFPNKR